MVGLSAKANENRPQLGIAMMLGAYFLFSLIDTSVKWLVIAGHHAFQLSFMRYFGAFLITIGLISRGGFSLERFKTDHLALVLLRGALLMSSTVLNFVALKYLPLTITSAIMFSAPIIVCLLAVPLLGERVGPWRWFAILLGFSGVLIVVRPFDESFHWAAILTVYNAFALALYSILTRKLSGVVSTDTMQFYVAALGAIALFPFAVVTWENPVGALDWSLMILLGLWGWSGHELLTRAHGFAPANMLMPYTYSFMIYLTIASFLVFNHLPDGYTLLGAVFIVISGLLIWYRERLIGRTIVKAPRL